MAYWIAGLAIILMGASYSASTFLEIGPRATVTGPFPEVNFVDTDTGDASWEIEANGDRLQIGLNAGGDEPFVIFEGADANNLVIDNNGNVVINGTETQLPSPSSAPEGRPEFEVFGGDNVFGNGDDANCTIAASLPNGESARISVLRTFESPSGTLTIGTRKVGESFETPIEVFFNAPSHSLAINDFGDIGLGVAPADVQADLHILGDQGSSNVRFETPGESNRWDLEVKPDEFALIENAPLTTGSIISKRLSIAQGSFFGFENIIRVEGDGSLGIGTTMPDAKLHVFHSGANIKVEERSSSPANRNLMELVNVGGVRFALDNTDVSERWEFSNNSVGDFNINRAGTGGPEMRVTRTGRLTSGPGGFAALDSRPNGNLFIAGTLFESSDRDKKENFEEVDCEAVLKQIADLSITTWNYKSDTQEIRHMGPVAQDFRSAFNLGDSDKTIATTDKAGVTLAAIKALNSKLKSEAKAKDQKIQDLAESMEKLELEKDGQIAGLEEELERVDSRMERLEAMLEKALAQ